mmetsp:Transcript_122192/g.340710  ORF Transcript_122192/g.340710 Transcript_122192/m.340710 type:complete len:203 (-) Transcript_122192:313-921(-)
MSRAGHTVNSIFRCIGAPRHSPMAKRLKISASTSGPTVLDMSFPGHIRAPWPNTMESSKGGQERKPVPPSRIHRLGRHASQSSPMTSRNSEDRRQDSCNMAQMVVPWGTARPSISQGSATSRKSVGATEFKRRDSRHTACAQRSDPTDSANGKPPARHATSAATSSCTSGCRAKWYNAQDSVVLVVSVPATRRTMRLPTTSS